MRSTHRLLAAHRELWDRAVRHPFLRMLERPPSEEAFRRWLGYEAYWFERALSSFGCLLPQVARHHRYVLAQALMLLTEELDWLEVNALPVPRRGEVQDWADRLGEYFAQGGDRLMVSVWLATRLQYDALRALAPEDELPRSYLERRTSPVVEAFLHDFEEMAEPAIEKLGLAQASGVLVRVVDAQAALWDLGLALAQGKE